MHLRQRLGLRAIQFALIVSGTGVIAFGGLRMITDERLRHLPISGVNPDGGSLPIGIAVGALLLIVGFGWAIATDR